MTRRYADEPVGKTFPRPPRECTDKEGRELELRRVTDDDIEALVEMYLSFDSADRAQGIPPSSEQKIRDWLDIVLADQALNVVAWDDETAVGHTMLVADEDESYELAIFVQQRYQNAGIGTELMRTTLGAAQQRGIERIWLSVERWNKPAITLYEKVGFEPMSTASFEIEMTIRLGSGE